MNVLIALVAAVGLSATTAPAIGAALQTPPRDASVMVQYSDLDLSHRTGAGVLYRRLQTAADRVCQTRDHDGQDRVDRDCVDATVSLAVRQVGAPELTAAFQHSALGQWHAETTLSQEPVR